MSASPEQPDRRVQGGRRRGWVGRRTTDRESAQRIIDAAHDAFVSMDAAGRVTAWNRRAEQLTGWPREEALGRDLAATMVSERFRPAFEAELGRFLGGGESPARARRLECTVLHRHGHEIPVEIMASALRNESGDWACHAFVTDISARRRAERDRAAILAATRVLATSSTVDEALPQLLAETANGLGCGFGAAWLVDPAADRLRSAVVWQGPAVASDALADATRTTALARGECLPGRVWQTGRAERVEDVASDEGCSRGPAAAASGLHGAKAVPIEAHGRFVGVLEFLGPEAQLVDDELLEMLAGVGAQLGEFIDRADGVRALAAERELQAALLESLADAVVACDAAGTLTFFNRAARELHGVPEESMTPEEWARHYHLFRPNGEPLPLEETPLYRALHGEEVSGAEMVIAPPGREPRTLCATGRPLIGPDGRPDGAVVAMQDVTAERRSEAQLRRMQKQLLEAERIAQVGSFEWEPGTGAGHLSDQMYRIFGLEPNAVVAPPEILALVHPDEQAHIRELFDRAVRERAPYAASYRVVRGDGTVRWVEVRARFVAGRDGPERMVGIVRDVTDRSRAEEAERANRAKSEFLSRMSHELRTPLNAILGFGQLLEAQGLDERQQGDVRQILNAGRHLLNLINEVLEISRIEQGGVDPLLEPVHAGAAVAEVTALVAPLADEAGIAIDVQEQDGAGTLVLADPNLLKQVLVNLLSNAVKFNREGGRVTVSFAEGGEGRLRIAVGDTGRGIAAEDIPKLFVPFERLGAEKLGVEGTGLGLALSERLVDAMGGALTVESRPGAGSTFFVALPVASEGMRKRPPSATRLPTLDGDPPPPPEGRRRTLLHVDDSRSNLMLVEQMLGRRPDLRVVAAMLGRDGLELAREERPELVLLDVQLPDMNGDEVLAGLRADPAMAGIPVVMLSADATQAQIERLLAAGAYAYLTKPFDLNRLLELVEELVPAEAVGGTAA